MRFAGLSVASIATVAGAMLVTGLLGGLLTNVGPWYRALRKPRWNPPNWVFPPAWGLIYVLTGSAIVIAWNAADVGSPDRARVVMAAAVNLALNVAWSGLFFALRRPGWALVEVVALWLSIVWLLVVTVPVSAVCGWLLAPYLAWVTFASVLNARIVTLNPRGGR